MNTPLPWMRRTLLLLLTASALAAETVDYDYDAAGRLVGVRHAGGLQVHYLYDAAGNLLVRRTQSFLDIDGDGMDDAWEMSYFKTLSRDGTGDFDGDASTDRAEFLGGTDPIAAQSVLKVIRIESPTGVAVELEWQSVSGKRYRVQYRESLSGGEWRDLPGDITAAGGTSTKVDEAPGEGRYYRILLVH